MTSPDADDSRLLALYRRYLGEPERTADVFVGFALFFGGIAVGAIGLLVFLASVTAPDGSALFWQLREVALVLAAVGLPALLLSIVVLLPVSRRATHASLGGVALCLAATGIFVAAYPQAWNVAGTDYSPHGISVYAAGLAVLVASTGAALVAHHLERVRPDDAGAAGEHRDGSAADEPAVTDEEVQRDIEETVAASELTWGGVEAAEPKRLTLSTEAGADLDTSGFDVAPEVRTDVASEVDDSVQELRKLRGWEPKTERGSDVDDQTDALKALREQSADDEDDAGWLRGVVDRFRRG